MRGRYTTICIEFNIAQNISNDPPPSITRITVTIMLIYALTLANIESEEAVSSDLTKLLLASVLISVDTSQPPYVPLKRL